MKVSKSNCVALLIALGYAAADKMSDKEVLAKINTLPDIVDEDQEVEGVEKSPKMKKLLKAVLKCHKDDSKIIFPDMEAEQATAAKAKKKKKKKTKKATPPAEVEEPKKKKKKAKKVKKADPPAPKVKKKKAKKAAAPKKATKDTVRIMSAVAVLEKVGKSKVDLETLITRADDYHGQHGGGSNLGAAANELKKAVKVMAHLGILDWDGKKVWKV